MRFLETDGTHSDFVGLCRELDDFLNDIVGGEKQRVQYTPLNALTDIHDVVVAYVDGRPIGCGGFKRFTTDAAEVKRVFVEKEYRGRGISRMIMERLEEKAREKGYARLILETGEPLAAAMHLYTNMGFVRIPNYGPYQDMHASICMEKIL